MNIRQLRIFQTVCEENSFTMAAKRLYMTQPAVSHVITDLEEEIGTALFDRLSRKIYLTQAGRLFQEKAALILKPYEELEKGLGSLDRKAPVRIGSTITIANFELPGFLTSFRELCTDTPLSIRVDTAAHIMELLLENEVDLAFIEGAIPSRQLKSIPYSSYEVIAACSPSDPVLDAQPLPLSAIKKQPLLLREKGSAVRNVLDSALTAHDMSVEPFLTSVNSQALIQAARQGLGITFLPDILLREEFARNTLVPLKIRDLNLHNQNHLVFHQDKFLSRPMKAFLSLIPAAEEPDV